MFAIETRLRGFGRAIAVSVLLTVTAVTEAHGGLVYDFLFDESDYSVAPSGEVDVTLFLRETVTDGATSQLGPAGPGIVGIGARLQFDIAPTPTDRAEVLAEDNVTPNSVFNALRDFNLISGSQIDARLTSFDNPTATETASGNVFLIPVATYKFTAGNLPGEVTNIRALDIPGTDDTVLDDGIVLDSFINNGTATITTTPEPSSFVLMAVAGAGILLFRNRRCVYCFVYRKRSRRKRRERKQMWG